jgi:glycosidase
MIHKMFNAPLIVIIIALILLGGIILAACQQRPEVPMGPESSVVHPEWSKDAVIYEVNIRQYTVEGTFDAFAKHLPRLNDLGVDILWLMPIHPIGEKNRKGILGSYYSVKDYKGVNPEFGDMEDLKALIDKAHEMGMYVILDWVANHTAWDNAWVEEHPDWYTRDENGEMIAPFDWTDVAELDYTNEEMRDAMIDAMKFWVKEADVDGYRCDVAAEVPVDFWNRARRELDELKPVFMLAEAEVPEHHFEAFDMSYAWELHHIMNQMAKGKFTIKDLDDYFKRQEGRFPADAYRMNFITNHDENSWNGTEFERLGDAVDIFAVLTFTLPGMPMIYTGQEAAFNKRLEFFKKDYVIWNDYPLTGFYTSLIELRKQNPALWSGLSGGKMKRLKSTEKKSVYAFLRRNENNIVLVAANLSGENKTFKLKVKGDPREMTDWFTGEVKMISSSSAMNLEPWGYKVFVMNKD